MTADFIQNQTIGKKAPRLFARKASDIASAAAKHASRGQIELTRNDAFLDGEHDIFDVLASPALAEKRRSAETVIALLKQAQRKIEESTVRIDQQERRIRELEALSTTDDLTGLPNRRGFYEAFRRELARAKREKSHGGVLIMIDLDNFKAINDSHGHMAGDSCLRLVAKALQAEIRATDTAARLGGDEFVMLLAGADVEKTLERVQQLTVRLNRLSFIWGKKEISVSASVGIKRYGANSTVEDVFKQADKALYRDKERPKI